jgi:thymidylate synthase (FAD)
MSELQIWEAFNGSRVLYDSWDHVHLLQHSYYDLEGQSDLDVPDSISGGDRMILRAARISTRAEETGVTTYARDRKLLRYLWEHKHTSVFEQVTYQFTVVMPLYVMAQWKRHRTWHMNEFSRRYSGNDWVEFEKPEWHLQNTSGNKQGGDEEMAGGLIDLEYEAFLRYTEAHYNQWLDKGMAKEDARRFLPQTTMTCAMFTVDLKNLTDFIFKRCDPAAQREIRVLAYILKNKLVAQINPWVHELIDEAFTEKGWPLHYE